MSKDFEDMWKDFENWSNTEAWNRIQKDYDVNHLLDMNTEPYMNQKSPKDVLNLSLRKRLVLI
jgi:hypothetical protein